MTWFDEIIVQLSPYEFFQFMLCPVMGTIGGYVHLVLVGQDWSNLPELVLTNVPKEKQKSLKPSYWSSQFRMTWIFNRIVLGFVAGLVIFLLMLGSIKDGIPATAKVLAIAFFAGLSAPTFFKQLEDNATSQCLKRLLMNEKKEK